MPVVSPQHQPVVSPQPVTSQVLADMERIFLALAPKRRPMAALHGPRLIREHSTCPDGLPEDVLGLLNVGNRTGPHSHDTSASFSSPSAVPLTGHCSPPLRTTATPPIIVALTRLLFSYHKYCPWLTACTSILARRAHQHAAARPPPR